MAFSRLFSGFGLSGQVSDKTLTKGFLFSVSGKGHILNSRKHSQGDTKLNN